MKITINLQEATDQYDTPTHALFTLWVETTLEISQAHVKENQHELTLRIVNTLESATLNQRYRGKNGPTNVLSFVDDPIPGFDTDSLGDLILCAPLVEEEAISQKKEITAHWAHLVIHGTLHLLGYDHLTVDQAALMESIEIEILGTLQYPNPYDTL